MPQNTDKNKRLVSLFLLGAIFFNYPLLSIFNHKSYVLGFPIFIFIYIQPLAVNDCHDDRHNDP